MKFSKLFIVLVIIFFGIFLISRLWQLDKTPLVVDEPANIRDINLILNQTSIRLADFQWDPSQATLFYYPTILLIKLGINDKLLALRYTSMIFSLVTLISFYFLVKKYTEEIFALCATLLLSSSYYFLHFSRVGWSAMSVVALGMVLLTILTRLQPHPWIKILISGLIAGILFYGYRGGSVFLIGSLLFYIFPTSYFKTNLLKRLSYLLGYLLIFLIISAPWWKQILTHTDRYDLRYQTVSILNTEKPYHGLYDKKEILIYQTITSLKSWFIFLPYDGGGTENSRYLPLKYPQVSVILIPFFYLGLIIILKKFFDFLPFFFIYLLAILTGQILTVNPPNGARGLPLLPLIYFFISLGLYSLYQKLPQSYKIATLVVFTLLVSLSDIIFYFWWMSWIKIF